jgi:hypothetical protein
MKTPYRDNRACRTVDGTVSAYGGLVPKRPETEGRPRDGVAVGDWPEGGLSADPATRYVQLVARALSRHLQSVSLRGFSRAAGVSAMTVTAIRDGDRYPDLRTLARLEQAAGCLLPDWADRRGPAVAASEPHHTPSAPLAGTGDEGMA